MDIKKMKYCNNVKNLSKNDKTSNDTDDNKSDEEEQKEYTVYRENNHIYFYTEINRNTISHLNLLIRQAEEYCIITSLRLRIDDIPIYIHIYSDGGYIHSAFTTIDVITSCKVPVYSIIEGATASAGTLISIVCTKRFIRPTAYMLIHQLSSECWGKMSEITDEYKNLTNVMNKITDIYKQYSTLSSRKLNKLLNHDLWLDSEKSIKYGLVDELFL
jgi:ATP-dependent protease ClpP protease subunit